MKGSNIPSRALASLLLLAVAEAVPLNRTLVAEATLITTTGDLPDYAITYAPYLYLNSDESWCASPVLPLPLPAPTHTYRPKSPPTSTPTSRT